MKKDINAISPEARAIIRAQLSRRSLFAGVGAVSTAGLLAACGTGTSGGTQAIVDVSDSEKIVRWANWPLYLDFDEATKIYPTLAAFEKQSGLKVTYEEGKEFADSLGIKFIESSAKKANNVEKAFFTIGNEIKNRV